eukprot:s3631_g2.t1
MDACRRRADGSSSLPAAESDGAAAADVQSTAGADLRSAAGADGSGAAGAQSCGDDAAAVGREDAENLALVGQELVPVHMANLSTTPKQRWSLMMKTVTAWYSHRMTHMTLTPIQRLSHHPTMPDELKAKRWGRLERRAASLLMPSLPEPLREEIIASKSVTTLGILSKAMLQYQPGGLGAILQALDSPSESASVPAAITQLRKWIRWKRRALELRVSIPDSSILMHGLSRIMKELAGVHPELNFRPSLVRNTVPMMESVTQYSDHLLAELEQIGQDAKKVIHQLMLRRSFERLRRTSRRMTSRGLRESQEETLQVLPD